MLLRFRVANHKSIRDEVELSLVSTRFRRSHPVGGDWMGATVRVAGIYGANASGKSNVLDAMSFAQSFVRNSATSWGSDRALPHHPFALDESFSDKESQYVFDFVLDGVRYEYGFAADAKRVKTEWLNSFPTAKKRLLFSRDSSAEPAYEFGRFLTGENVTTSKLTRDRALFLSTAANSNHKQLTAIFDYFDRGLRYARYSDHDRDARLQWTRSFIEKPETLRQAESLLGFADVGISKITVQERPHDQDFVKFFKKFSKALEGLSLADDDEETVEPSAADRGESEDVASDDSKSKSVRLNLNAEEFLSNIPKAIRFHHGPSGRPLGEEAESSGTLAWLSLAVPALHAIESGQSLLVDELDASLHPRLSSALISLFKEPKLNPTGAQLIFTSHDATLLGQFSHSPLEQDEVWFCEKDADGRTELFALAEFSTRKEDNFERRYLQGRYGAVPMIASGDLVDALLQIPGRSHFENELVGQLE